MKLSLAMNNPEIGNPKAQSEGELPVSIGSAVFAHYFIDSFDNYGLANPEVEDDVRFVMQTVANHNELELTEVEAQYKDGIKDLMFEFNGFFAEIIENRPN